MGFIVCRLTEAVRTDDTENQKGDEEEEEERPDTGGVERVGRRNDRMDVEMRHCVAGEQGKGGGAVWKRRSGQLTALKGPV